MEETVAIVEKNSLEAVHVALTEYRGLDLVDLRIFANYGSATEAKRATKKGICMKVQHLPALIYALQKAEHRARAAGLLDSQAA